MKMLVLTVQRAPLGCFSAFSLLYVSLLVIVTKDQHKTNLDRSIWLIIFLLTQHVYAYVLVTAEIPPGVSTYGWESEL